MDFDDPASGDVFSSSSGGKAMPFDLNKLLITLRRFFWIIPITTLLGLGVAYVAAKATKPNFRSTAEIKIERRSPGASSPQETTTPEDLKTIEQSFISPDLMRRVIDALHLESRDDFMGKGIPAPKQHSEEYEDALVGFLMSKCKVALVPDTRLLQISFDNWNQSWAQEVANAIVTQGVEYDREQRYESLSFNVKYLQGEAAKLEANLKVAEEQLNDELKQIGIVSVDDELNIEASQLRDLNSRYTAAKTARLDLESQYDQIEACRNDPDKLIDIESIRKVPAVERLYQRAGELRGQLVKLAQRYRDSNPLVIQTQTELKEVEASLKQEILAAPKSIEVALAAAKGNEDSVAREQKAQEQEVMRVNGLLIKPQVRKRQIDADRLTYEATLKRLNEELAQARSQPVLMQIVNPAGPGLKTSIGRMKILVGGVVGGIGLGAGLIFLLMQLDSTIRTPADAESALHLSVLSVIPAFGREGGALSRKARKKGGAALALPDLGHSPLVADQYSSVAEAFRTWRAAIQIVEETAQNNYVLVTSAVPGEGKSFCALNLAVAMAHSGQRTLLVDAQLRKPVLEERVFASRGSHGLSDYLQGATAFSSVIRTSAVPNLDVVTAGSPTQHPAEILSRGRLSEFLAEAQRHYDRVVFDSTSITPLSDTLGFARFFSVVCLVFRAEATPPAEAKRAIELLTRAGAKPFGLVLNFGPAEDGGVTLDRGSIFSDAPGEKEELDFPKICRNCGRVYENLDDYLKRTAAPPEGMVEPKKNPEAQRAMEFSRLCQCGAPVIVSSVNRRDLSDEGVVRRQVFEDLQGRLIKAGLSRDEARGQLLLTLKIWRSEISGDTHPENSEAGKRRSQLFDYILDRLERSGLSHQEAKEKLLQAIQIWRTAP